MQDVSNPAALLTGGIITDHLTPAINMRSDSEGKLKLLIEAEASLIKKYWRRRLEQSRAHPRCPGGVAASV